jgi:membrane protease YdiL (CAAX protease family)
MIQETLEDDKFIRCESNAAGLMDTTGARVGDTVSQSSVGASPVEAALSTEPSSDIHRPIASFWHTVLVLVVQGLLSYRGAVHAGRMRALAEGHRVGLYERTIFIEWMMLGLVLLGVWWHGPSVHTVLGERWRTVRHFLIHLGIAVLFLVVTIAIGSIFEPRGEDHSAARLILPEGRTEMWLWVALSITAGICEEAIYRGYFQRQFIAATKSVPVGIVLSGMVFGVVHLYQGFPHALRIGLLGIMSGILAYWLKSVRPGMIAHTLQDILGGLARH